VGQQPNIELEMADLPRPTEHPGAPRRWSPTRVAELGRPADVPRGGRFGTPGPDAGYALTLLAARDIPTVPGESRRDAIAAVAALMTARASAFGRAPVIGDAEGAEMILGYRDGAPEDLVDARTAAVAGLAHHPARSGTLVAATDTGALTSSLDRLLERVASGETLIDL